MPSYENPEVDHSVNTSAKSAVREFAWLSLWLAVGVTVLVCALYASVRWLSPLIPFHWEQRIASTFAPPVSHATEGDPLQLCRTQWLQSLADDLHRSMQLPPSMRITVHWSADPTANALATLGGHVIIYQGLLDAIGTENALAMVMAHEIAHIQHRDPIASVGAGLAVQVVLSTVLGTSLSGDLSAKLSQLHFSRQQEKAADEAALHALRAHYGHLDDADGFFVAMQGSSNNPAWTAFMQSHPHVTERIQTIAHARAQMQMSSGIAKPLPPFMQGTADCSAAACTCSERE